MAQALTLPKLERDAYEGVARALYSQGGGIVTLRQERILQELRTVLHVSQEHHQAVISRVQAEFERAPADIDTALVGDREITMPVLSAFALKPAKVASATAVPQMTKKRKTPAPALPAAAEEAGNGEAEVAEHVTPSVAAPLPSIAAAMSPLMPPTPPAPKIFKFEVANVAPQVPVMVARAGVPPAYVSYFTYQPQAPPGK